VNARKCHSFFCSDKKSLQMYLLDQWFAFPKVVFKRFESQTSTVDEAIATHPPFPYFFKELDKFIYITLFFNFFAYLPNIYRIFQVIFISVQVSVIVTVCHHNTKAICVFLLQLFWIIWSYNLSLLKPIVRRNRLNFGVCSCFYWVKLSPNLIPRRWRR
jgi:hypothetical protein